MQTDDLLLSEFSAAQNTVILHKPHNSNIPQSSFRAVSTIYILFMSFAALSANFASTHEKVFDNFIFPFLKFPET